MRKKFMSVGEDDYKNMEIFLKASGLHTEEVRRALQEDLWPLRKVSGEIQLEVMM